MRGKITPHVLPFVPVDAPDAGTLALCGDGDVYTTVEAQRKLRVSKKQLRRLMDSGQLAYVQFDVGCRRFIPKAALLDYLARHLKRGGGEKETCDRQDSCSRRNRFEPSSVIAGEFARGPRRGFRYTRARSTQRRP